MSGRRRAFKDKDGFTVTICAVIGIFRLKVIAKVVNRTHDPVSGGAVIEYDVVDRLGVRARRAAARRVLVTEISPVETTLLWTTLDQIQFLNRASGGRSDHAATTPMFRELYGAPAPAPAPVPAAPPAPVAPPDTLLIEAGLRRVLPGVLQGAQNINVADLGRLKAVFSENPHVAKAVSDKIYKQIKPSCA